MAEWRDRNSSCIANLLHHVVTVSFPRLLPIVASLPCLCDVCSASESFMYASVNARTSCSQQLGLPVVICVSDRYPCMQTQQRAVQQAATGDKIKGMIDSYMETSRKSTAEYGENMLSKASALSKRPKHELVAVASAAAAAAAAAWWASAPKKNAKKKEEEPASTAAASPTARASGSPAVQTSGTAPAAGKDRKKEGSVMGTVAWLGQAAVAAYAAGSAASATISTAGDFAQLMSGEGTETSWPCAWMPIFLSHILHAPNSCVHTWEKESLSCMSKHQRF